MRYSRHGTRGDVSTEYYKVVSRWRSQGDSAQDVHKRTTDAGNYRPISTTTTTRLTRRGLLFSSHLSVRLCSGYSPLQPDSTRLDRASLHPASPNSRLSQATTKDLGFDHLLFRTEMDVVSCSVLLRITRTSASVGLLHESDSRMLTYEGDFSLQFTQVLPILWFENLLWHCIAGWCQSDAKFSAANRRQLPILGLCTGLRHVVNDTSG